MPSAAVIVRARAISDSADELSHSQSAGSTSVNIRRSGLRLTRAVLKVSKRLAIFELLFSLLGDILCV